MKTSNIVLAVAILAVLGLTFNVGYNVGYTKVKESIIERTDTIYHTDTFMVEKPTPKYVMVVDSIYVPVYKPSYIHDTTYVALAKEVKVYEDSTYKAQVSGYQPSLDWIEVYQKNTIITNTIATPRKKFGFSIVAGPSVVYSPFSKHIDAGVGVTAGLSYTF